MPERSLKPCKYIGCPELTRDPDGYCQDHKQAAGSYDRYRGSARQRGYDKAWERLRIKFLRDNPLCHDCLENNQLTPANEVHHKKKVRDYPELRLNKNNLMALCPTCHKKRTARGE